MSHAPVDLVILALGCDDLKKRFSVPPSTSLKGRRAFFLARAFDSQRSRDEGSRRGGFPAVQSRRRAPVHGKAERFVQTSPPEWANARAYNTSDERAAELPLRLRRYNWRRPHGSLGAKPPITRLTLTQDNVLRPHS